MMFTALLLLTLVLALLTFLPISRFEAWWVRGLDFPRLQLLVVAVGLLILQLCFLDLSSYASWAVIALAGSCLAYQAWWIIPYSPLFPVEVLSARPSDVDDTLSIMTANVLMSNRNAKELVDLLPLFESQGFLFSIQKVCFVQYYLHVLSCGWPAAQHAAIRFASLSAKPRCLELRH